MRRSATRPLAPARPQGGRVEQPSNRLLATRPWVVPGGHSGIRGVFNAEHLSRFQLVYEIVFIWHLLFYLAELGWSLYSSVPAGVVAMDSVASECVLALLLMFQLKRMLNRPGYAGDSELEGLES